MITKPDVAKRSVVSHRSVFSSRSVVIDSPFGALAVRAEGDALTHVAFWTAGAAAPVTPDDDEARAHPPIARFVDELARYARGALTAFTVPVAPAGTDFQKRVWRALSDIPFGETASYRDVAERIGAPRAARAVGAANGKNPLALVVPCHRVVAHDGSLGGYAFGLDVKRALLAHERAIVDERSRDTRMARARRSSCAPPLA